MSRISVISNEASKHDLEVITNANPGMTMTTAVYRSLAFMRMVTEHVRGGGVVIFRDAKGKDREMVLL